LPRLVTDTRYCGNGFFTGVELSGTERRTVLPGSYTVTNLGAFIAVIAISEKVGSDRISDYDGVLKRSPMLALALTLCLISLTGIPLTAGFLAKFYIFSGAVQKPSALAVIIAVFKQCSRGHILPAESK